MIRVSARRLTAGVLALAAAVLLFAATLLLAGRAAALVPVADDTPGGLSIHGESDPLPVPALRPGQTAHVQLAAHLAGAETASLTLELQRTGPIMQPDAGLTVTVHRCDTEWAGVSAHPSLSQPSCSAGEAAVAQSPPGEDPVFGQRHWPLADITPSSPEFLLLEFTYDPADAPATARSGEYGVRLTAQGESAAGPLPVTGSDPTPAVLGAVALLIAGLAALGTSVRLFSSVGRPS